MVKLLTSSAIAALSLAFALGQPSAARAAYLNFAADADANGERPVASLTLSGVSMNFSALKGLTPASAYLDASGGAGPAGLGVCGTLSGNDCVPSSDDNVSDDEFLSIVFTNGPFSLSGFSFTTTDHQPVNPAATLLIALNDGDFAPYTFAQAIAAAFVNIFQIDFKFGGGNPAEFYISGFDASSAVPLPGALPLLISGFAGLGFAARRKRAQV